MITRYVMITEYVMITGYVMLHVGAMTLYTEGKVG